MSREDLLDLIGRIESAESRQCERLEQMSEYAERTGDYTKYDERNFDFALESQERLSELLVAVKAHLAGAEVNH